MTGDGLPDSAGPLVARQRQRASVPLRATGRAGPWIATAGAPGSPATSSTSASTSAGLEPRAPPARAGPSIARRSSALGHRPEQDLARADEVGEGTHVRREVSEEVGAQGEPADRATAPGSHAASTSASTNVRRSSSARDGGCEELLELIDREHELLAGAAPARGVAATELPECGFYPLAISLWLAHEQPLTLECWEQAGAEQR